MTTIFIDIQGHWAADCIRQLATHSLVQGYADGRFSPEKSLSRAEFAALVYVAFVDATIRREPITFEDVSAGHWAFEAIQFAYQTGFLSGYPQQRFKPDMAMPRVQAITALVSGFGHDNGNIAAEVVAAYFDDAAEIPGYGVRPIATAIQQRLIVNYPNQRQLRPNADITRAEVAALLCRALQFYSVPPEFIVGPPASAFHPDALMVITPQLDAIGNSSDDTNQNLFVEGLARVERDRRSGFINEQGQLVISPNLILHTQVTFSDARLPVVMDNKLGYIDRTGQVAISPQFDHAEEFSDGLAIVAVSLDDSPYDRYGVIDRHGDFVVAPQYDGITPFDNGLAIAVTFDGLCHGIDRTGQVVFQIAGITPRGGFQNGYAKFLKDKRLGLLDRQGNIVLEPKYYGLEPYSEERAWVKLNGDDPGFRCVDLAGNPISSLFFKTTNPFFGGFARAMTSDGELGYLDRDGHFSTEFEWIGPFSEGLATAYSKTHQGYVNVNRQWVILPQFDDTRQPEFIDRLSWDSHLYYVHTFSEGRAAVAQNGKFGFIDHTGTMVIPAQFDWVEPFSEGLAAVHRDGEDFYIDLAGQPVFKSYFPGTQHGRHRMVSFKHGYALFQQEKRFGLMDKAGNIVMPAQFDHVKLDHVQPDDYRWIKVNLNSKHPHWDAPLRENHPPFLTDHNWGLIRLPKAQSSVDKSMQLQQNNRAGHGQGLRPMVLS